MSLRTFLRRSLLLSILGLSLIGGAGCSHHAANTGMATAPVPLTPPPGAQPPPPQVQKMLRAVVSPGATGAPAAH